PLECGHALALTAGRSLGAAFSEAGDHRAARSSPLISPEMRSAGGAATGPFSRACRNRMASGPAEPGHAALMASWRGLSLNKEVGPFCQCRQKNYSYPRSPGLNRGDRNGIVNAAASRKCEQAGETAATPSRPSPPRTEALFIMPDAKTITIPLSLPRPEATALARLAW